MSLATLRPRSIPRHRRFLSLVLAAASIALAAVAIAPPPARGQSLDVIGVEPVERFPVRMEDGDFIDSYSSAFAPAADNGFYALWFELAFDEQSPGHLMGQRFDGQDQPIGNPRPIGTSSSGPVQGNLQVRRRGDRMLAIWQRNTANSPNVYGRFLDTRGAPQTPVFPIGAASGSSPAAVLLESGNALVVWRDSELYSGRLVARIIEPDGTLGPLVVLAGGDARYPAVGVDGQGRILVVWHAFVFDDAPYFDLMGRWLDSDGHPTSSAFVVARNTNNSASLGVWPDGGSVAVWATCTDQFQRSGCEIRARALDSEGKPLGRSVRLSPNDGRGHVAPVTAMGPDGVLFVSWQACPSVPGGNFGICRFHAVALDEDGDRLATAPVLDVGGEQERRRVVALDDDFMVSWYAYNAHPDGVYTQRYRFTAASDEPPPPDPQPQDPPPPAGIAPLTSAEVPGFRFWVQIGDDPGAVIGVMEPVCIPETVCVSGALPGRSEVFVRVVGPKLNGYLWPTLVKFSTSRVQVWIEQDRTGAVRYYDLAAASPGSSALPGLFDREGFQP